MEGQPSEAVVPRPLDERHVDNALRRTGTIRPRSEGFGGRSRTPLGKKGYCVLVVGEKVTRSGIPIPPE